MPEKEKKAEQSLKYSIIDGIYASIMTGFTLDYFTPYLLALGGSVRQVGAMNALPNLISSIIQLKSVDISERLRSRMKAMSIFVLLQAAVMFPMIFIHLFGASGAGAFVVLVTLFTTFGALINPVWGSLMSDLVPAGSRGDYFGRRSKILGFVTMGATFAAGLLLYAAESFSVLAGFSLVFAGAFVFRVLSWKYLVRMEDPGIERRPGDSFSIIEFVLRTRHSNFARFVFFVSLMKFAVNVASPFFAVLMLSDLGFDYLTFMLITVVATLASNISIRRWGKHADHVGNLKVVKLTSRLVAVVPLLWLFSQNPVYLFFVQAVSGFSWAGYNLASSNFVYDACTQGKRARCIAYFNFFNGVSLSLGAFIGGMIAHRVPAYFFDYPIMNVVLLSVLLRLAVAFLIPFNLSEVRPVRRIKSVELFFSMVRRRSIVDRADNVKT